MEQRRDYFPTTARCSTTMLLHSMTLQYDNEPYFMLAHLRKASFRMLLRKRNCFATLFACTKAIIAHTRILVCLPIMLIHHNVCNRVIWFLETYFCLQALFLGKTDGNLSETFNRYNNSIMVILLIFLLQHRGSVEGVGGWVQFRCQCCAARKICRHCQSWIRKSSLFLATF